MATQTKSVKEIPVIKDSKGCLLSLTRKNFPKTSQGIEAYCDYKIEYWKVQKVRLVQKSDPSKKLEKKRAKLVAALKEVEVQIEATNK